MAQELKSPLRYPGGKQKDIPLLSCAFNQFQKQHTIQEYREPFLGGGSVLLYALGNLSSQSYWANDAHPLLMDFWLQAQEDVDTLCELVYSLQEPYIGPKHRSPEWTKFRLKYLQKLNKLPDDRLHRAARFFILNRSTASGTTESGGLTPLAYCERFTASSIERLRALKGYLNNVLFTCNNYSELIQKEGENVLIFLDPPYLSAEGSGLYGKSGNLHKGFNHGLLAAELKICPHFWLMTIDNSPQILQYYSWANLIPWDKPYSMTNIEGRKSKGGQELLISNFDIDNVTLFNQFNKNSKNFFIEEKQINPKLLKPHPVNQKIYGEDNISDLLDSIHRNGFYKDHPILVQKKGKSLQIISGHRRCRAAIELQLSSVPIIYTENHLSDLDIERRILDENLHRRKDGIQIIREFEYRKYLDSKKNQNVAIENYLKNGKISDLEQGHQALEIAEKLRLGNHRDESERIEKLIRNHHFIEAWHIAQEINDKIYPKTIQGDLFLNPLQKRFYLTGVPDEDAEKIIAKQGQNYLYLSTLVRKLENYIIANNSDLKD